jgi:hypothetical protein
MKMERIFNKNYQHFLMGILNNTYRQNFLNIHNTLVRELRNFVKVESTIQCQHLVRVTP